MVTLTEDQVRFVRMMRVGRLATADQAGRPHVIPVCYAYAVGVFYIALDAKPKRVEVTALKRVRNILDNPQVALVIDHYSDDWTQLAYLLVQGAAQLLAPLNAEHDQAVALLRERYPPYRAMPIETTPLIKISVERVIAWGQIE